MLSAAGSALRFFFVGVGAAASAAAAGCVLNARAVARVLHGARAPGVGRAGLVLKGAAAPGEP